MRDTLTLDVRRATLQDDLAHLLGGDAACHRLNYEQVFVAESARGIEGMVVLFDGGHSLIYVDHLVVCEGAPKETGPQLMLAVNRYCQEREKTVVFVVTASVELAYMGKRRGAVVVGPLFRIRYNVTDEDGGKHRRHTCRFSQQRLR